MKQGGMRGRHVPALLLAGLLAAACGAVSAQDGGDAAARLRVMGIEPSAERLVQFAAQGDATVVKLLLQAGIGVDARDALRQTSALHNAAAQGHVRLVKLLLERGAQVDRTDWHGNTALVNAAYFGHLEVARLLLAKGAQINILTLEGQSPLSAAVYSNDAALVGYLLAQGADVRLAGPDGRTALDIAELGKRDAIAQAIRQRLKEN